MKKHKPTKKWLKEMILDEKKASRTYIAYGFPQLAKDERHHRHVLQGALRKFKKVI
jgi:hypothetical protein